MIRILLAEDQIMVRQGLKLMIESDPEMKVTGESDNGKEAISLCEKQMFDIVILDIRMPVMDGIETAKVISARWPDTKILILTTFADNEYVLEALKIGVSGYILKTGDTESLLRSIRSAFAGGLAIEDHVAANVMPLLMKRGETKQADPSLTPRERAILTCIGEGLSNGEIADRLAISIGTVKNNTSQILTKLELRDRTQLAIYAIRHDLV
ncbi:response regulator transcription factor [Oceanobacillus massiliensis]|uniref:response regulator transcription factor n=1 Tax=Oceanobacillus massiliensis TaxID=1465765 RepID=UPI00301AFDBD